MICAANTASAAAPPKPTDKITLGKMIGIRNGCLYVFLLQCSNSDQTYKTNLQGQESMRGLRKVRLNVLLVLLLALAGAVQASDHEDSPAMANNPIADILDFYAFMNPSCRTVNGIGCDAEPEELILALTVNPHATAETQFSDAVEYHFNFENDVGVTSQIVCAISSDQMVSCAGLNGLLVSAPVGEVGVNGDIRVFAGLRDDPSFLDEEALSRLETEGVAAFSRPGLDFYAGSNVMAIVVGIKNNAFPAGSGAVDTNGNKINVQRAWVASERTRSGINAGVTGSWYNPAQSGQGWVIEMVSSGQFVFYFYGYEDTGEQLWFIGIGDSTGDSMITVDVLRFSGTGFGGNFDPTSRTNESVGSMTFNFTDCNNAMVDFTSTSVGLSDFSIPAQRLTAIASVDCVYSSLGQIDRLGRPMIDRLVPEGQRDAYNVNSDPSTWPALFTAGIEAGLTTVDLADGVPGNPLAAPAVLAPIMADDRLTVDLEWSQCGGVWGIEFSMLVPQPHPNDCGGRKLADDVVDELLGIVVSGFDPIVSDFVTANDVPFLTGFPFLAAPH